MRKINRILKMFFITIFITIICFITSSCDDNIYKKYKLTECLYDGNIVNENEYNYYKVIFYNNGEVIVEYETNYSNEKNKLKGKYIEEDNKYICKLEYKIEYIYINFNINYNENYIYINQNFLKYIFKEY